MSRFSCWEVIFDVLDQLFIFLFVIGKFIWLKNDKKHYWVHYLSNKKSKSHGNKEYLVSPLCLSPSLPLCSHLSRVSCGLAWPQTCCVIEDDQVLGLQLCVFRPGFWSVSWKIIIITGLCGLMNLFLDLWFLQTQMRWKWWKHGSSGSQIGSEHRSCKTSVSR